MLEKIKKNQQNIRKISENYERISKEIEELVSSSCTNVYQQYI